MRLPELKPCPKCEEGERLLMSTPKDENDFVRDGGVLCMSCGYKGPRVEIGEPIGVVDRMIGLPQKIANKWNRHANS